MESNCKIELVNVTKRFGKVIANDSVNLTIEGGKVLCLLGENGSGKTTLMNVLSGIYMPEQGHILKNGVEIQIRSPKDAFANGIGMIHQHFKLVDVLTVTENIILGLNEKGKLNIRAAAQKIDDICKKYGFDLDPMAKIYDLSVSQKQTVEIVKVLFRGAEILILDEPTAVLTPQETDRLFQVVRNMRADGKAIVLITHKLHEVLSVSDEVAVLRKGKEKPIEQYGRELLELLHSHGIELVVLAGFLTILPENVIQAYPKRILNIHPSLIPSFCGAGFYGLKVHEAALAKGVKVTGATVHFVNEIPDGGEIIAQKAVEVLPGDTPEVLQKRVMEQAEWILLPQALEDVARSLCQQ